MEFFKKMTEIGLANVEINIFMKEEILSVMICPKSTNEKANSIEPIIMSATAEELDREFFNLITAPLQKTAGIISNIEAHEKSAEKASKDEPAKKTTGRVSQAKKKSEETKNDKPEETTEEKTEKKAETKSKTEKPKPEYKFQKYLDKLLDIVNVPDFKLKATNKAEVKEAVDMLLVVDKTNEIALKWETEIKNFVPSILDDEDDEPTITEETVKVIPPPIVEDSAAVPVPPPAVEEKVSESAVVVPPPVIENDDEDDPFGDDSDAEYWKENEE